jgi:GT2 family glycosyltransferase
VQAIGQDYEVIVTDDGKADEAKPLIEANYPWVTWVGGPKRGPAANRNHGARLAKGEWLVFLDDDCLPDTQLLLQYAHARADFPAAMAIEGAIHPEYPRQSALQIAPINQQGGVFWSCNIAVQCQLFFSLGGFDEAFRFPHMEDIDLQRRIFAHSVVPFAANAVVVHPWRIQPSASTVLNYHESYFYFKAKWKETIPGLCAYLFNIARTRLTPLRSHYSMHDAWWIVSNLVQEAVGVTRYFKKWKLKYAA